MTIHTLTLYSIKTEDLRGNPDFVPALGKETIEMVESPDPITIDH